jgi:hypothetical protein
MDSLVIATLLPLAQAAESAPQPSEIAGRILKGLISGESLIVAILGIAIGVVVQVLSYWIAAKVVVGDPKGTLGNAFKLWVLYLVLGLGFVMLLGIVIPMLFIAKNSGAAVAVLLGTSVLGLALTFLLPIKIFDIGLPRALGFLVLSFILMLAAQAAMLRAQGKPAFGNLPEVIATLRSEEKRNQLLQQIAGPAKPTGLDADLDRLALPAERAKPFPERQDNLRKVYEILDARQKTLPAGDAKAREEYDRLSAKYEELVRVLKADFAASKAQPPAP